MNSLEQAHKVEDALICPFKLKNLVDSAPEGVVAESLPVLVTGSALGRIACDCGAGVAINALPDPEQLGELAAACQPAVE